jgi:hypothetical protein
MFDFGLILNKNIVENVYIDFFFCVGDEIESYTFDKIESLIYSPKLSNIFKNYQKIFAKQSDSLLYFFDNFGIMLNDEIEMFLDMKDDKFEDYRKSVEKGFYWNPIDYYLPVPKPYIDRLLYIYFLIRNIRELKSKDIQRKVFNLLTGYF